VRFTNERAGDQEARNHEEHVDADIPARQDCGPEMIDQDGQDGDGPKSLNLFDDVIAGLVHWSPESVRVPGPVKSCRLILRIKTAGK